MYILVTGGAGYIGSHAAKMLMEKDYHVITLDNLSTGYRDAVLGGEFIKGDLNDKGLLKKLFSNYQIGAVMHFAANSLVGESMIDPGKYFDQNLSCGVNLLEAMKDAGVNKIIFSSSAAVYGEPQYIPIDEKHPINPTNVYGETKAMYERILKWYDHIFNIRSISLRYFNAAGADPSGRIGERHDPETHLIPIILQAASGKRTLKVYGNDYPTKDGTCIRDYIHVNDLALAHIHALEALINGQETAVFNLGNGNGFSVLEVIGMAESVTGKKINYDIAERRVGDPAVLVAGSNQIKNKLNMEFKYSNLAKQIESAWTFYQKINT